MQPIELAEATAAAIHDVPAAFMIDPATYQRGAELGYPGADFYFAGRGGVLGATSGPVVAAAFVFFAPELVTGAWDRSAGVGDRAGVAAEFAATGHAWARARFTDAATLEAAGVVARLGGAVVDAADAAGAPLFAGWRELAVPDDDAAAAHHVLNALRELRGAFHAGAVLGAGLRPGEAVVMADPHMAPIHGYAADTEVDETRRPLLAEAERCTNTAMAMAFAGLDPADADAFAAACATLHGTL